ncbi:Aspartate aminotransferase [uncultured archaeon]|nr:Aspartate aminotransferase [uncultured archaeon]
MIRPVLNYLTPYDAGLFAEDLLDYGVKEEDVVNLQSNENPYPLPKTVRDAITKASASINRYPKPNYQRLKTALSKYTSAPEETIAVGNGASDLLDGCCKIFLNPYDAVVLPVPGFSMYFMLAMLRDASLRQILCGPPDFKVTAEKLLSEADDATKMFIIPSPNNPTGKAMPKNEVVKLLKATEAAVVVDEAYAEFHKETLIPLVPKYNNLIVVRSMSKFFGLAGLRIGYAVAQKDVARSLESARLPFTLNNIAQEAAIATVGERKYFEGVRDKIIKERERLMKNVGQLPGWTAYQSDANFFLARPPKGKTSEWLLDKLNHKGILIRDVTGIPGLETPHVRITAGLPKEGDKLVEALKELS